MPKVYVGYSYNNNVPISMMDAFSNGRRYIFSTKTEYSGPDIYIQDLIFQMIFHMLVCVKIKDTN